MADRVQQAIDFFRAKGLSLAQAAGIVGNLSEESTFNPGAVGDGGNAYGIAQWHPDRQALFQQWYGQSIQGSTFEQQLQFVWDELNQTESGALNKLRNAGSVTDAVKAFLGYERPAGYSSTTGGVNVPSYSKRLTAANRAAAGLGGINPTTNPTVIGADNPVANAVSGAGSIWDSIRNVFTVEFAGRSAAVFIGIALIIIAIIAFVLKGNPVELVKGT